MNNGIFNLFLALIIGYLGITIIGNELREREIRKESTECVERGGEVITQGGTTDGIEIPKVFYCKEKNGGREGFREI